jgi:HTH-type transcriptional repressor of puuD
MTADDRDDEVLQGIGAAIRTHRTAAGLSMRELAARAGMSQPFLSNLENARAMPSVSTLYRLANALGGRTSSSVAGAPGGRRARGKGLLAPVDGCGSASSRLVAGTGPHGGERTFDVEPDRRSVTGSNDGEDFVMVRGCARGGFSTVARSTRRRRHALARQRTRPSVAHPSGVGAACCS